MTKQISAFLFCFTRKLNPYTPLLPPFRARTQTHIPRANSNLYSPLTLTLRPPIRPYFKNLSLKKYFLMYYAWRVNMPVFRKCNGPPPWQAERTSPQPVHARLAKRVAEKAARKLEQQSEKQVGV